MSRTRYSALLLLAACGDDSGPRPLGDAAPTDGAVFVDALPLPDGDVLAWVDFATSGCAPDGEVCRGVAPLAVGFAPIAPASVDAYLWTFGDDATSMEAAPGHVYQRPGSYDVALAVSGPGGTATAARPGFIVVDAAPLGAACTEAAQCAGGLCLAGLCAAACPCDGGVCAALPGGEACVVDCGAAACDAGACADLPDGDGGWLRGCIAAGSLAAIGASCAGPDGLDDGRCASGLCAPLGLRGACSFDCEAASCPDGTTCATFGNGEARCLAGCADCDDPWLGCVAPGGPGDLGFTAPDGLYCAPAPCADPGECPSGTCEGGYCRPL